MEILKAHQLDQLSFQVRDLQRLMPVLFTCGCFLSLVNSSTWLWRQMIGFLIVKKSPRLHIVLQFIC